MAFEHNILHPSRHVPWLYDFVKYGVDWGSAAFRMTFAAAQGGSAVITLSNAAAGLQGVSATYDAGASHPSTGAIVGATRIKVQIDEATLEGAGIGFPAAPTALALSYDLLVTPTASPQQVHAFGTLTIKHGVGD